MVFSGSIGCIRSNIWENMPPIGSDSIPLFMFVGWFIVPFLAYPFGQSDSGITGD